jgi:hypothetical protein
VSKLREKVEQTLIELQNTKAKGELAKLEHETFNTQVTFPLCPVTVDELYKRED